MNRSRAALIIRFATPVAAVSAILTLAVASLRSQDRSSEAGAVGASLHGDLRRPTVLPAVYSNPPATGTADHAVLRGPVTVDELVSERLKRLGLEMIDPTPAAPVSPADARDWTTHREAAARVRGLKIVVSIYDRRLWLIDGRDTLISTWVAVGIGRARAGGREFDFSTPRGLRRVRSKAENPVWVPPDWHYVQKGGRVWHLPPEGIQIGEGERLVQRGNQVGVLRGSAFEALPPEHPLKFGGTTWIPPVGTVNREIPNVLGRYKLDTGNGILIHGTDDPEAVALRLPITHGCIRVADAALAELYRRVPLGTSVYVY